MRARCKAVKRHQAVVLENWLNRKGSDSRESLPFCVIIQGVIAFFNAEVTIALSENVMPRKELRSILTLRQPRNRVAHAIAKFDLRRPTQNFAGFCRIQTNFIYFARA